MNKQNALPLQWPERYDRASFVVAPCNERALSVVENPDRWPSPILNLIGPLASGKTHIAHIFSDQTNSAFVTDEEGLDSVLEDRFGFIVIDDVDHVAVDPAMQEKLFFLVTSVLADQRRLLLTMTEKPASWVGLPDLLSRLQACPLIEIQDPDETAMKGVYQKLFNDRGLTLDEQTMTFLLYRSERHFSAIRDIVEKLDHALLAEKRGATRPNVARLLAEMFQT